MRYCLFGCLLILASLGCNNKTKVATDQEELSRVEFQTRPCHGRCPIYHLVINSNGKATLQADRFTSVEKGNYQSTLTSNTIDKLLDAINKIDWSTIVENYESNVADLQTNTITICRNENTIQKVTGDIGRPESIIELDEMLNEIYKTQEWIRTELNEEKVSTTISKELIVQFSEIPADLNKWAEMNNLKVIKKVAPNLSMWVFQDLSKNSIENTLAKIKKDPNVKEAQRNQKVEMRK